MEKLGLTPLLFAEGDAHILGVTLRATCSRMHVNSGMRQSITAALGASAAVEAAVSPAGDNEAQEKEDAARRLLKVGVEGKPRTRENSKQATVLEMLHRPAGATIPQIMEATGWQAHTVRGTFAGAFKKRLGLTLTSDKAEGGARIYRIA